MSGQRTSALEIAKKKARGEKIVVLTSYDSATAPLVEQAGVDVILVGDSVGNVMLGYPDSLPVTLEDMIRHTGAVVRSTERVHVVLDLPFMSYQPSVEQAVRSAGRAIKETGCGAVKLEAGEAWVDTARAIVRAGIPVMGHIGFTPQYMHVLRSKRVKAESPEAQQAFVNLARRLEDAGCYALVLELVPRSLAARVTAALEIPTIGIGSGPECDGQVLVLHDILGIGGGAKLRHVKQYANLGEEILNAARRFCEDVRSGAFPTDEHCFE